MKKLLLLLAIPIYLFSCNNSKTKTSGTPKQPSTLDVFIITEEEANAMMNSNANPIIIPTKTEFKLFLDQLIRENPKAKIVTLNAVYNLKDEVRYCEKRSLTAKPEACGVQNYRTKIFQLITCVNNVIEVTYYDFATLCPPPPDCE